MAQKSFNHISEELKERINGYIEASGLNDKEWIDRAVEVWQLHALKNEIPDFRVEIEEVEGLTNRIRNILVNLAQRTAFEKVESKRQAEEELSELRLIVEQFQFELSEAVKNLKAAEEESGRQKQLREEAEKYAKQVEQSSESNRALAESYKEKNGALTDLVAQYKNGYDQSQSLRNELAENQRRIGELERQLAGERERHAGDLERAAERREVEYERELLRVRTELHVQLQEAVQSSTAEIRGLYERIDQLRFEHEKRMSSLIKEKDDLQKELDRARMSKGDKEIE